MADDLPVVSSSDVGTIRPQGYDNLEICLANPINVYIGRARIIFLNGVRYPPEDSIWANPFKLNKNRDNIDECLLKYRMLLEAKILDGIITLDHLRSLRGKILRCWCKKKGTDVPCHGDVIREFVGKYT